MPRRFRFSLELARDDGDMPTGTGFTMTMEMWEYGIEVDVSAPPADQVTDLTSLVADAA